MSASPRNLSTSTHNLHIDGEKENVKVLICMPDVLVNSNLQELEVKPCPQPLSKKALPELWHEAEMLLVLMFINPFLSLQARSQRTFLWIIQYSEIRLVENHALCPVLSTGPAVGVYATNHLMLVK